MIGLLEGKPIITVDPTIIMMVSGVGYRVAVSTTTRNALQPKQTALLHIHTAVKDSAIDLYGFMNQKELALFKLLLGVSGVGPKTALTIVDFGVNNILKAVAHADVIFFTQIPKVGKKMAQKIIIDLKNKVGSVAELDLNDAEYTEQLELVDTFTSMGYSPSEARAMISTIPDHIIAIEEKIRFVLKSKNK